MPRAPRPGKRAIYVEVDEALAARLEHLAARNRRTIKAEVVLALEVHLDRGEMGQVPAEPVQGPKQPKGKKQKQADKEGDR